MRDVASTCPGWEGGGTAAIILYIYLDTIMQLFVKSLLGNTWQVSGVKETTNVETLKLLIYRITSMHPSDQLLYWGSVQLEDPYHVGKYGLLDGSPIRLHPKMRSGLWAQ